MSNFAVIAQNDESQWDDIKGDIYNYPNSYVGILTPGCKVIYYKGKMTNKAFESQRLSPNPHYFGIAVIGESIINPDGKRNERYCEILNFQEFEDAVPLKENGEYLESIPESRRSNFWRFGVREADKETYDKICALGKVKGYQISLPSQHQELESFNIIEGNKKDRYSSYYERNPFYRNKAIEIHGLSCMACGFNFENVYGQQGKGFIHVHHNKPLFESGPTKINPKTDMTPLCPNCHAMIHRKKGSTLSVDELKKIIERQQ